MSIHVRVVTPVTTCDPLTLDSLQRLARSDLVLTTVEIEKGPPSIESEYDEALAVPDTLRRIVEAERQGVHAVVIDCMGDPGLRAARELVSIPVLGPAEVSLHTAAMLGEGFSIVTVLEKLRPLFVRMARMYGVTERVKSVRSINIPVLELSNNPSILTKSLCDESLRAVRDDGAAVIVLGCTGFVGLADAISAFLRAETGIRIPVIDPLPLTVLTAAAWVGAGISQSQCSYRPEVFNGVERV
jgi:allantoin racemase